MTPFQRVLFALVVVLHASLLLALLVRGSYRVCWSFFLYCAAVLVTHGVFALWPDLLIWTFWLLSELLHAVLKFIVAAEIGWRIFGPLPGARSTLAAALLFVSLATLWSVIDTPSDVATRLVAVTAMARVNQGTAWVFGAILAAKLYFRLPAHPLHQAILRGFVTFLMLFTVGLGLLETYGGSAQRLANASTPFAYLLLLVYWNVVAWRKADDPQVPPEVMQKLQPWR